jgi:hypothetical protein
MFKHERLARNEWRFQTDISPNISYAKVIALLGLGLRLDQYTLDAKVFMALF